MGRLAAQGPGNISNSSTPNRHRLSRREDSGRLFPIFRDREELPVSADLGTKIEAALRDSRYLIVICTPHSARSRWVNEEIKSFKKLGREDKILALIVAGEPHASEVTGSAQVENECFPPMLRYRWNPNDDLLTERAEPLAADARAGKDGRNNAKLKLLAGILGIDYDQLRQRDHERRLRRARIMGAAALLLVAVLSGLTLWAVLAARQAAAQKKQTQRLLVSSDSLQAEELFGKENAAGALVYLARATEQEPDRSSTAAERLWFALTERSWPVPISASMAHQGAITSASFSPDGSRVVTSSRDGTACLWDAKTGRMLGDAMHHGPVVRNAFFTPTGTSVVTTGFNGIALLWKANSGKPVPGWRIKHEDSINSVALSAGGKWIATGCSDGSIRVCALADAAQVAQFHQPENVHTLVFDPANEDLFLSLSGKTATLWNVTEKRSVWAAPQEAEVNAAQFDPTGARVVTATSDGTVAIWNSATGKREGEDLRETGNVSHIAFSHDGRILGTVVDQTLSLWDMNGSPHLRFRLPHSRRIACLRFTPDDSAVATGTNDGRVQGYGVSSGKPIGEPIREDGAIASIDMDAKGERFLIATAAGTARIWRPPPRYPLAERFDHGGSVESMNVSPDGRFVFSGSADGSGRIWDLLSAGALTSSVQHGGSNSLDGGKSRREAPYHRRGGCSCPSLENRFRRIRGKAHDMFEQRYPRGLQPNE